MSGMNDVEIDKLFRGIIFAVVCVGLLGVLLSTCDAEAKVEYSVVEISDLKESDSGRHVAIHGWTHEMKKGRGRFGSNTSQLRIEGLLVVSAFRFFDDVIDEEVLVLGTYRHYCKFGGLLMDGPCVIVDQIMGGR